MSHFDQYGPDDLMQFEVNLATMPPAAQAQKIIVSTEEFYDGLMEYLGNDGFFFLIMSREESARLNQDEAARNRRFADAVFKLYAAAAHFAKVSPLATDIAKIVNESPQEIINWSKTPLWKQTVKSYGWHGNPTPQEELLSEIDPIPLRESYLIQKAFQRHNDSRIRFSTYDAAVIARVKYIEKYHFVLWDSGSDDKKLDKLDVVLAFPDENLPFIKKGVVRRQSIADEGLRPIEKASERPKIKTDVRLGSIVKCVMRYGLVVVGEKVWDSRFYMVLRVGGKKGKGGKILIAYKHALLDFHVLKEAEKRKKRFRDDWDDENTRRG